MSIREKQDLTLSKDEQILSGLMRQSQSGDTNAYGELLMRIKDLMEPFVANILKRSHCYRSEVCDEICQEILLNIHAHRANYDPKQYFLPWLYSIGRYKTIDFLRKNKKDTKLVAISEELDHLIFEDAPTVGSESDIQTLGAKLPEKQWRVLQMMKLENLSIQEISEKTGFSPSDVKVTVHRAIKKLKELVRE